MDSIIAPSKQSRCTRYSLCAYHQDFNMVDRTVYTDLAVFTEGGLELKLQDLYDES